MSKVCEQLFQKCYQRKWVSWNEKQTFLKNCEHRKPRTPGTYPPSYAFSSTFYEASTNVTRSLCRNYAGSDVINRSVLNRILHTSEEIGTQALGAAVLVGITVGAVYQLRFGNTGPLQRLLQAL